MNLQPGATTIAVGAVTLDFGNTIVRVDRPGLRAVIRGTADQLAAAGTIHDVGAFLAAWAEERDRQFRDSVPLFQEVDLDQRVVRVLARLRGLAPPGPGDGWDDEAAARLVEPAEVDQAVGWYSAAFVATMAPLPEADGVIRRLAARGFRLAILSNWPLASTIDRYAEAHGWLPLLEAVIVSQRIGTIKPHPEIFRQAALLLATPPARILHVGDDWAADIEGASRAGWRTAYVRNRQGDSPLPASEPGDGLEPDFVVDDLTEIEPRIELWTA